MTSVSSLSAVARLRLAARRRGPRAERACCRRSGAAELRVGRVPVAFARPPLVARPAGALLRPGTDVLARSRACARCSCAAGRRRPDVLRAVIGAAPEQRLTASGWRCSAAHISAVVPRRFSRGVDVGAGRDEQLDRLRIAVARREHHHRLAVRPALASHRRRPSAAARSSAVAVRRRHRQRRDAFAVGGSTFAPAPISRLPASRSSRYTAQCSAVAPSTCGAFTSAFCWRSAQGRRVALITASATSLAAAAALPPTTARQQSARHEYVVSSVEFPTYRFASRPVLSPCLS